MVKKLESAFRDLVVASHPTQNGDGGHTVELAVVLHDPDFGDTASWAPSLAVRAHAANLAIVIPARFPVEQPEISVRALANVVLQPHPLLRRSGVAEYDVERLSLIHI